MSEYVDLAQRRKDEAGRLADALNSPRRAAVDRAMGVAEHAEAASTMFRDLPAEKPGCTTPAWIATAGAWLAQNPEWSAMRFLTGQLYGESRPNSITTSRSFVSGGTLGSVLEDTFNTWLLEGFRGTRDTTAGWIGRGSLPNFCAAELQKLKPLSQLTELPRGGHVDSIELSGEAGSWRLRRYAAVCEIDEMDVRDIGLAAVRGAINDIGAASRRVILDAIYSTLLGNGVALDDVAFFHGTHANTGASALSAAALGVAMGVVAGQSYLDAKDTPVYPGFSPRVVLCPPSLIGLARQAAKLLNVGDASDLIVECEPRLCAAGVRSPRDGSVVPGSDSGWYLFAAAGSGPPAMIIAGLGDVEGAGGDLTLGVPVGPAPQSPQSITPQLRPLPQSITPQLRVAPIAPGEGWGLFADVTLDLAIAFGEPKAAYRSIP